MKAYWGNGVIVPRILNLRTRWNRVVSFTTRPLYRLPPGKSYQYPLGRILGGPQKLSGHKLTKFLDQRKEAKL